MKSCFQIGDYCFIYPECQGFKPDPKITLVTTLLIPTENDSILTVSVHSDILNPQKVTIGCSSGDDWIFDVDSDQNWAKLWIYSTKNSP